MAVLEDSAEELVASMGAEAASTAAEALVAPMARLAAGTVGAAAGTAAVADIGKLAVIYIRPLIETLRATEGFCNFRQGLRVTPHSVRASLG